MPEVVNRNEVLSRARAFVVEWTGATSERSDSQTFWNDFLDVFGVNRRQYAVFESEARRASTGRTGRIDMFWPEMLAVEHKSAGEDLEDAADQLRDYLPGVAPTTLPRIALVCDFDRFHGHNLDTNTKFEFPLADLANNLDRFMYLAGRGERIVEDQETVNLKATRLLSALHDALRDSRYDQHDLRLLMVRLLFILFADDTDIFDRNLFQNYVEDKTREDGSDLGERINRIFEILNQPEQRRSSLLDSDLAAFPYINGDLFSSHIPAASFTSDLRRELLEACRFDWAQINPAIFGSMFQEVMTTNERRHLGAHYTTETNILRTIDPLCMDALRAELTTTLTLPALRRFRDRLATLTFFDPACGCGNFLLIAYRELRVIELACLVRIRDLESAQSARQSGLAAGGVRHGRRNGPRTAGAGQQAVDVTFESKVRVSQFYGIEIEEFPAQIARTAMYLMDHLANRDLSTELGDTYARFPIQDSAHISQGNALTLDWDDVLPGEDCDYLLGNPPFSGQSNRTDQQTAELAQVWGTAYSGYLDYVTGWYAKAIRYTDGHDTDIAFVSTNSICQGEPVAPLWQAIFDARLSVLFAHRTFNWRSEARGGAGVHVVIIGLTRRNLPAPRRLFNYPVYGRGEPTETAVSTINAYLFDGPNLLVRPRSTSLARDLPEVTYGNKPTDGGFLLISPAEIEQVRADLGPERTAAYVRPFVGARELIYNQERWCLWLTDLTAADLRASHELRTRIDGVKAFRLASRKAATVALAQTPALFDERRQPTTNYLCIPRHVGEARDYFPVAYFAPEVISGDHNFIAVDPDGYLFGLMSSSFFMTWMRTVAGRIRGDLRFSKTLVWHNFPLPDVNPQRRQRVIDAAATVIEVRAARADQSLDDLYEPGAVPDDLMRAHHALDRAVASCFSTRRSVATESERRTLLFERFGGLLAEGTLNTGKPSGRAAAKRRLT